MTAKRQKTRADLERENAELRAQMTSTYVFAAKDLTKTGTDTLMGSGVLVRLTALGGRDLVPPFVIRDGLHPDTIGALRADVVRSYEAALSIKPRGSSHA